MRRFVVITALTALTLPVAPGVHGQDFDADRQFCADGKTDPDAAISACTRQIQSGGLGGAALARAFFNRGFARSGNRQYSPAIQDYDAAIRLNPEYADAFSNRGLAYDEIGQTARAIQDYDAAIRLNPGHVIALNNRGNAYRRLGQTERAIQDFDAAIRLDPGNARIFRNRGNFFIAAEARWIRRSGISMRPSA